jgi:hypothetical protein
MNLHCQIGFHLCHRPPISFAKQGRRERSVWCVWMENVPKVTHTHTRSVVDTLWFSVFVGGMPCVCPPLLRVDINLSEGDDSLIYSAWIVYRASFIGRATATMFVCGVLCVTVCVSRSGRPSRCFQNRCNVCLYIMLLILTRFTQPAMLFFPSF